MGYFLRAYKDEEFWWETVDGERISPIFKRKEWAKIWIHEYMESDYEEQR